MIKLNRTLTSHLIISHRTSLKKIFEWKCSLFWFIKCSILLPLQFLSPWKVSNVNFTEMQPSSFPTLYSEACERHRIQEFGDLGQAVSALMRLLLRET